MIRETERILSDYHHDILVLISTNIRNLEQSGEIPFRYVSSIISDIIKGRFFWRISQNLTILETNVVSYYMKLTQLIKT